MCGHHRTLVCDTRPLDAGNGLRAVREARDLLSSRVSDVIVRRRRCTSCKQVGTTIELPVSTVAALLGAP